MRGKWRGVTDIASASYLLEVHPSAVGRDLAKHGLGRQTRPRRRPRAYDPRKLMHKAA